MLASHDPQIAARSERMIWLRDGAVAAHIDLASGYSVEAGPASSADQRARGGLA